MLQSATKPKLFPMSGNRLPMEELTKKQCCPDENFNSKPSSMSNCEVIVSETLTAGGLIVLMRDKAKRHCL